MVKALFITVFFTLLFTFSCVKDDADECDNNNPCKDGFTCVDGRCVENIIETPDEESDDLPIEIPDENEIVTPDEFEWPDIDNGLCEPLSLLFCDPDNIYNVIRCDSSGNDVESVPCGEMTVCVNAKCVQQICTPGEPFCNEEEDLSKVYKCNEYGSATTMEVVEDCGQGGYCLFDKCVFHCDLAAQQRSYQGCDYFTAHLYTQTRRRDPIYALVISNLYSDKVVTVDITNFTDTGEVDAGKCHFCVDTFCQTKTSSKKLKIDPGKLGIVQFPHEKMVKDTGKHWNSYRIKTDLPVTVYQFSPFDNSFNNPFESNGRSVDYTFLSPDAGRSYSNDASLLIPTSSVYTDYIAVTHVTSTPNFLPGTSYITIIGVSDKDTKVSIKPSVNIAAKEGVPAITAGSVGTVTVKKGEIVQVEAFEIDITGTRIFCNNEDETCNPFVVFAGTDCAFIPGGYGYCDHLEQQMFPVQTWGKKYLLVKSQSKVEEWDFVKIVASENGTVLTFSPETPAQISVPSGWKNFTVNPVKTELKEGEFSEFYFKGTLLVEANKPIMVAQFLTASEMLSKECQGLSRPADVCVGDPAMMLIPPTEQFRKEYKFLTPGSYKSNFATIVMTTGEEPVLNGEKVENIEEIAGTEFSFAIVDLGNAFKSHNLECPVNPCGLFVYGWEADVSYAYPGGLDLELFISN